MFHRKYKYIKTLPAAAGRIYFTINQTYINYSWDSSYFRFKNDIGYLVSLHELDCFKLNDLKETLKKL